MSAGFGVAVAAGVVGAGTGAAEGGGASCANAAIAHTAKPLIMKELNLNKGEILSKCGALPAIVAKKRCQDRRAPEIAGLLRIPGSANRNPPETSWRSAAPNKRSPEWMLYTDIGVPGVSPSGDAVWNLSKPSSAHSHLNRLVRRMESHCLRHDRLPGASRLLLDYVYRFENLSSFYTYAPYDPDSVPRAAEAIQFPSERRRGIVQALSVQNPGSPLLEKLAGEGTVAVATGQQVGYLGGPAYTVYKALTAIRVAEKLEASGIPAVPVFWLASEDHDLEEVDHAWLFDGCREPLRYQAKAGSAEHDGNSTRPVGSLPIPPLRREELERAFADLPFGAMATALAGETYREGQTYAQAFRELLERMLGSHRLLFLDPLAEEIRTLAAPLLARAVEQFPVLSPRVIARGAALEKAGYHTQVHLEAETSFFFLLSEGERLSLKARNGGFANGKRTWSAAELAAHAASISPNALLRPVLQDYLLPTACLVGGGAEIAYLAQSAPLYEELLGREPVFLPRNGFTLVDGKAVRYLDRYGLTIPDCFSTGQVFEERLGRTRIPTELKSTMASSVSEAEALLDRLRRELLAFDPTLAAAAERSRTRVLYQFQKLERKTAREVARREVRVRADAHYLSGLIYPGKHLQERTYSFLPFLAAYGTGVVDLIYAGTHEHCQDHHVLMV